MKKELQLLPYLTFDGKCREAMEFYKGVFGGELTLSYFREIYSDVAEADKDKVMHAMLDAEQVTLMASDTVPGAQTAFGDNIRVTLTGTNAKELAGFYEKLSAGGSIFLPFEKQVWGQELGMFTDKFGTLWSVSVMA